MQRNWYEHCKVKLHLLHWLLNSVIAPCVSASVKRHWLHECVMRGCQWLPCTNSAAADELINMCMQQQCKVGPDALDQVPELSKCDICSEGQTRQLTQRCETADCAC